jgi:hypothetical protein
MSPIRLLLVAPVLLLPSASVQRDAQLAWGPAPGTTLRRTHESRFSLQLDELVLSLNGQEQGGVGTVDLTVVRESRLVVTDVVEEVADAGPVRLTRRFDELHARESTRFASGDHRESADRDHASALEGATVVFAPREGRQGLEATWADDAERDAELLEELVEDMDLRRFLPPAPVSEGETWAVDGQAFLDLLDPGGDLALVPEGADEAGDAASGAQDRQMRETMAGSIRATLAGTTTEGELVLARILLEVDTAAWTRRELPAEMLPDGGSGSERVDTSFRMKGELLWDLEHGHAHSVQLAGANDVVMRQVVTSDFEGEVLEQVQEMRFGGERTMVGRFERE